MSHDNVTKWQTSQVKLCKCCMLNNYEQEQWQRLLHKAILMFFILPLSFHPDGSSFSIPFIAFMETMKVRTTLTSVWVHEARSFLRANTEKKPRGMFKEVKGMTKWHKSRKRDPVRTHHYRKIFKISTCHSWLLSCLFREQKDNTQKRESFSAIAENSVEFSDIGSPVKSAEELSAFSTTVQGARGTKL